MPQRALKQQARRGRTKVQLYDEAKRMNIAGRSKMNTSRLQRSADGRK